MASIVNITIVNDKLHVACPFNAEFVSSAKALGGKWVPSVWLFDVRDEQRVRGLCRDVYGSDGSGPDDTVTLRIEWRVAGSVSNDAVAVYGRTIARATGRDSGARNGDGVVVLAGGFDSGGSRANWTTTVAAGTVVLVRDFPRSKAEQLVANQTDSARRIYSIEHENSRAADTSALLSERYRLVARIAEIDAALAGAVLQREEMRCANCGKTGRRGEYPFSTVPDAGRCDDCA